MGRIPVENIGMLLKQEMCTSVTKTFLGWLSLQGASSSKFNSSFQWINSFDYRKLLMEAASASSSRVQVYLPCAELVKQFKIYYKSIKENFFHNWTVQLERYLDVSCNSSPRIYEQQQWRKIYWYCFRKVLVIQPVAISRYIWQCFLGFQLKATFLFWK